MIHWRLFDLTSASLVVLEFRSVYSIRCRPLTHHMAFYCLLTELK